MSQHLSRDEFGEMAGRKRVAEAACRAHGHQMDVWHERKGDSYGRSDAYCVDCNMMATVCVEPPDVYGLPLVYGKALSHECGNVKE